MSTRPLLDVYGIEYIYPLSFYGEPNQLSVIHSFSYVFSLDFFFQSDFIYSKTGLWIWELSWGHGEKRFSSTPKFGLGEEEER